MKKEGLNERIIAVNALVSACAKRGDFRGMARAVELSNRGLTAIEIAHFLENFPDRIDCYFSELLEYVSVAKILKAVEPNLLRIIIKRGSAKRAKRLAEARGKKLNRKEIDALLLGASKSATVDADIFGALALKPSQKALSTFIEDSTHKITGEHLIHDTRLEQLFEAAKMGASKRAKNKLVRFCLERHSSIIFFEAVGIAGRNPTPKEMDRLMQIEVERGYCGDAVRTAKECRASPRAVNKLLKACIEKGELSVGAWAVALGPSKKNIEALLKACISKGYTSDAKTALSALKRKLSPAEEDKLLDACIGKGFSSYLAEAQKLAGRDFTKREKNKLLRISIKNCRIGDSVKSAALLGRELTVKEILRLKKNYLKKQ